MKRIVAVASIGMLLLIMFPASSAAATVPQEANDAIQDLAGTDTPLTEPSQTGWSPCQSGSLYTGLVPDVICGNNGPIDAWKREPTNDGCTPTIDQIQAAPELEELLEKDIVMNEFAPEWVYTTQSGVVHVALKNCLPLPVAVTVTLLPGDPTKCEVAEPDTDATPQNVGGTSYFVMAPAGQTGVGPINSDHIEFDYRVTPLTTGTCNLHAEALYGGSSLAGGEGPHSIDISIREPPSSDGDLGSVTVSASVPNCDNSLSSSNPGTVNVAAGEVDLTATLKVDKPAACFATDTRQGGYIALKKDGHVLAASGLGNAAQDASVVEISPNLAAGDHEYEVHAGWIGGLSWSCRILIAVALVYAIPLAVGGPVTWSMLILAIAAAAVTCLDDALQTTSYTVTIKAEDTTGDCTGTLQAQQQDCLIPIPPLVRTLTEDLDGLEAPACVKTLLRDCYKVDTGDVPDPEVPDCVKSPTACSLSAR